MNKKLSRNHCSRCGHHAKYHHTNSDNPGYSVCNIPKCGCDRIRLWNLDEDHTPTQAEGSLQNGNCECQAYEG